MPFFKRSKSVQTLTPTEANARADLQIIDVRSRQEWNGGHVQRARHIPLDELPGRLSDLHSGPVAFICQSGMRSQRAAKMAAAAGVDAVNINGGMAAWQREGLPVARR